MYALHNTPPILKEIHKKYFCIKFRFVIFKFKNVMMLDQKNNYVLLLEDIILLKAY